MLEITFPPIDIKTIDMLEIVAIGDVNVV